jgi:hypothetical protein
MRLHDGLDANQMKNLENACQAADQYSRDLGRLRRRRNVRNLSDGNEPEVAEKAG